MASKQVPNNSSDIDRSISITENAIIDPNCTTKKIGSILIENRSKYKLHYTFTFRDDNGFTTEYNAIVEKNETNPVMGLPEGTYGYYCYAYNDSGSMVQTTSSTYSLGSLTVIKCKETLLKAK